MICSSKQIKEKTLMISRTKDVLVNDTGRASNSRNSEVYREIKGLKDHFLNLKKLAISADEDSSKENVK